MALTHRFSLKGFVQFAIFAVLCPGWIAIGAEGSQYWALLRDGSEVEGELSGDLHDPANQPRIGGKLIFAKPNPAVVVVQRGVPWSSVGSCIELANGDVLTGKIVRMIRAADRIDQMLWAEVAVEDALPLPGNPSMTIRVRADAIRRVAGEGANERAARPGELVFRDGRRTTCRNLRWARDGLRALLDNGAFTVSLSDLAEFYFQDVDSNEWLARDSTHPALALDPTLVTLRTANGGRYTYPRAMVQTAVAGDDDERDSIVFQPAWTLDAVRISRRSIAACTYRPPDEAPVSHLQVLDSAEASAVHDWSWRIDSNVFGGPLSCGSLLCDLGIGMHAPCSLTFRLPPGAQELRSFVGLDNTAGNGGCVKFRVTGDDPRRGTLLESGFVQGSTGPMQIDPVDVKGLRRLTMSADMAHQGRPAGADPMDLRDHANWLMPMVSVEMARLPFARENLADWIPELKGWAIDQGDCQRLALRAHWDKKRGQWRMAMMDRTARNVKDASTITLRRRLSVTLNNALMHVAAGRDTTDSTHHLIQLQVNDQRVATTMNGDVRTNAGPGDFHDRFLLLSQFVGQQVELELAVEPMGEPGLSPAGIVWYDVSLRPLIGNLSDTEEPIQPTVPLTSLQPIVYKPGSGRPGEIQAGKNTDGSPLLIRGYPFASGFGVQVGSSITYALDPSYRRFVAVLGLSGGWQEVGAYTIYLDGHAFWSSMDPMKFGRNTPGWQIDLPLPAGHQQIELRVAGRESYAAWAAAGFMTSP